MVRKALILLGLASILLLSNNTEAGTLNRGVSTSSFHIAGGAPNGGPLLTQLKYNIAVDHHIGIGERYTVRNTYFITNTYSSDTYGYSSDTYSSSYSSSDTATTVWIDANFEGDGKNELQVSANDRIYEKGSNPMDVKVDASFEGGDKNELQVINSITN